MVFKAVAIDLDGTLLVGEDIPPENVVAVQAARDAGISVMIATARWSHLALRLQAELGIADPIIACSGAQVLDPASGRDVFDHRLPADFCEVLYEICNAERCIATVTTTSDVTMKLEGALDPNLVGPEVQGVSALKLSGDDLPRVVAVQGRGCNARIRAELEERFSASVNILDSIGPSGKIILTITAKQATKGAALSAACGHLGIVPEQVVAFGDSENDLAMFECAGAAVAMGQADEATKAAATYISKPNTEGGVAHGIYRLLERGEV